jgi:hypothetical protein
MKRWGRVGWVGAGLMGGIMSACATDGPPGGGQAVNFTGDVKPILEARCLPCHNGALLPGMLDLRTREGVFAASPGGAVIVPGDPGASRLLYKMTREDDELGAMPPTGHGLSAEEQRVLTEWIREGADWPEGKAGQLRAKKGAEPRSI